MGSLPLLVDAPTLARHLGDPGLRVFDATAHLRRAVEGGPYTVESGLAGYEAGHIPGAAFADIPGALSDPTSPYPFTLPGPDRFAAEAGAIGIGDDCHVVVYARESPMWATRLWWVLRYFGFDSVSVLDGGLPAWSAAGGGLEQGRHRHPGATLHVSPRPGLAARLEEVAAAGPGTCLLNALTPAAFRGDGPGAYSRPGRIPGSTSLPAAALVDPATGCFLGPSAISERLAAAGVGDEPVIAYCGGGISATVDLFALALVGRHGRLYDGSLTEWSAHPDLPLETG
jgi:thiosulfate/3-mercaptopyruvate sulfurtransferase